jgi:hypothetical protein
MAARPNRGNPRSSGGRGNRASQAFTEREYRDIGGRVVAAANSAVEALTIPNAITMVENSSFIINNASISSGDSITTSTLPGTNNIPATGVTGVLVAYDVWCSTGVSYVSFAPTDVAVGTNSPYCITSSTHGAAGVFPVKLGPTGAIRAKATSGAVTLFYAWIVGYW